MKIVYMTAQAERVEAELMAESDGPLLLVELGNGVTLEMRRKGRNAIEVRRSDGGQIVAMGQRSSTVSDAAIALVAHPAP